MSPDTFRFFHAIGVNVKQLYGLTESGIISIHTEGNLDPATVGPPLEPGSVKLSKEGEILFKSDRMSYGYYKNPEATAQLIDSEGWLHTGDGGYITDKGHIVILGRVRDLDRLPSGDIFAPEFIESRLGFSPYIKYAMVLGGKINPSSLP